MFKHACLAAAAAVSPLPAFAQAALIPVELEGPIEDYQNETRTVTVMGMPVDMNQQTVVRSPTTTRNELGISFQAWFRGRPMDGRTRVGMLDGMAIVTGVWDPATNRIVATDVFTEPSENVNIGVITANWCTTPNCDGPNDYLRGNSSPSGGAGPAMVPILDRRMAAGPVTDEPGFELDLTGVNLNGMAYVAEGYYGNKPVPVRNTSGALVSEKAFHYFHFGMANPAPELYRNKTSREIAVLRADCREGERFEMTGFLHTRVSAAGGRADTITPASGVAEVRYTQANGQVIRRTAAATPLDAASPVGRFRIRFDTPGPCPTQVAVHWMPQANANIATTPWASQTGVAVEVRDDGAGDD